MGPSGARTYRTLSPPPSPPLSCPLADPGGPGLAAREGGRDRDRKKGFMGTAVALAAVPAAALGPRGGLADAGAGGPGGGRRGGGRFSSSARAAAACCSSACSRRCFSCIHHTAMSEI